MRAKFLFGAATAAMLMAGFAPAAFAQDGDQPGDASTTARFTPGQQVDGEINPAGDADWYRMSVQSGQRYSLTLDGVERPEGALDPTLGIYDAEGNQLAFNDDGNGLNSVLQYAPSESGDVFVEARAFGEDATGAYRLNGTAEALPEDVVGNDASTRARVRPGTPVTGSIDYEGDVDAYRLDARTGQRYHITLNGAEGAAAPLGDPMLAVADADGNELASNDDDEGLNSALDFIPRTSGPVYVQARGYGDSYTGTYTLNVVGERMPNDGLASDRSTRGRLTTGQTLNGAVDYESDTDWYRIRLTEGEAYRFTLVSSGDSPLSDPVVRIYDANSQELSMDDDGGEGFNSYLEFAAPSTGNYFVEASGFGSTATGGYTLAAFAGDIPADASTDVSLSPDGDYREGTLSPEGDRDWYKLQLSEGQALRINVAATLSNDALADPYIVLYGPDGAELARDDDGGEGLNAFLEFQATAAGGYFVEVRGFSEEAAGRYSIGITGGEIGASSETADSITPNGDPRTSVIGAPDDSDWFGVELVEGRPYRFNLEGVDPNPLADPMITLYDSEGREVASDDDGGAGLNSYLSFTSSTGGTHFAAVSSYGAGGTGAYTLRVTDTDVPGNVYTDENLSSDGDDSRISRIDVPADLDYYRVTLEAGVRYVIDVRGHGDNPLSDPYLVVVNSQNERAAADDDSGDGLDARLRFTPTESGEYYIQASGLGGSTGGYQVQIVRQ